MSDPDDYTIGWICAVQTEYVAAQAFLDESHPMLASQDANDNNTYKLGRMGNHKIAIACLPHRNYGLVSAAKVARDMLRTFTNLRFGLMVGIGGGVPTKKDIRLGDVVVSSLERDKGAIFQYDYGIAVQNKTLLQTTAHHDAPPLLLQAAVQSLQTEHILQGNQIKEAISTILDRNPRLKKLYREPDPSTDRLYRSDYVHRGESQDDCALTCGLNNDNLIVRASRDDGEDLQVHYGLIASANQLMKDASVRDRLAQDNVLCFEMEAAGLVDHFKCLVIRGICDYSDSHKNDEWQGFAAMTAAAYAKQLLNFIVPTKIQAEGKIGDQVAQINENVQILQAEAHIEKITKWLSPPNPSTNHNNALSQRLEGTGQWLLASDAYLAWRTEPGSFLWLNGITGCGKTILSSGVIDDLESSEGSSSLLYFYFDFADTDKRSFDKAIRSLINQLYLKQTTTQGILNKFHKEHNDGARQPSTESMLRVLRQMLTETVKLWIVLDGLDEIDSRKECAAMVQWIMGICATSTLHVLAASRPEEHLRSAFESWARPDQIISLQTDSVDPDIGTYVGHRVSQMLRWQSRQDIQEEIQEGLTRKAHGMFRWAACQLDELEKCVSPPDIRTTLAELPRTLDETYERILKSLEPRFMHHTLRILQFLLYSERPLRVDEAVDAITVQAESQPYFDAQDRLPEPDNVTMYASGLVVLVETESERHSWGAKSHKTLQLAHFSVKEYLASSRLGLQDVRNGLDYSSASSAITKVCLSYLLAIDQSVRRREREEKYPFMEFAATYWVEFASASYTAQKASMLQLKQYFTSPGVYEFMHSLQGSHTSLVQNSRAESPGQPLYGAALMGLDYLVRVLPHGPADVNMEGGFYGNALQAASFQGNQAIVRFLLDCGAALGSEAGFFGSAIQAASFQGHEAIVQTLIRKGADPNAQGGHFGSALQAAAFQGHSAVAELLMESGAELERYSGEFPTAVVIAMLQGHESTATTLLQKDIKPHDAYFSVSICKKNLPSFPQLRSAYGTLLHIACMCGHESIASMLLARGFCAQGSDTIGTNCHISPLHLASFHGHSSIVKLLIENNANVNCHNAHYGTPIYATIEGNYEAALNISRQWGGAYYTERPIGKNFYSTCSARFYDVAQLLLEEGADVHKPVELYDPDKSQHGRPLSLQDSTLGHIDTSKFRWGNYYPPADTTIPLRFWALPKAGPRHPLFLASLRGNEEVFKLLLEKGADVNAEYGSGHALHAASLQGCEGIVRLILEKGADPNFEDPVYGFPLHVATREGNLSVMRLLLDHGADVDAIETHCARMPGTSFEMFGQTPQWAGSFYQMTTLKNALYYAAFNGHEQAVRLLLDAKANVHATCGSCGSALAAAAFKGHIAIVQQLLHEGAEINRPQEDPRGTALQYACGSGHAAIAELLLNQGAHVNAAAGQKHGIALQAACLRGHTYIVKLLLDFGAEINRPEEDPRGTALQYACCGGHLEIVELLLDQGAHVNAAAGHEYGTALEAACLGGHTYIIKLLLDFGAEVQAASVGWVLDTVRQNVSRSDTVEIIRLLVGHGADINLRESNGGTVLQRVLERPDLKERFNVQQVRTLLDLGANVNAPGGGKNGQNALRTAIRSRSVSDIVRLLLERGADADLLDAEPGTALRDAVLCRDETVVQILLEKGADINDSGGMPGNALHDAEMLRNERIVQMLLKHGAIRVPFSQAEKKAWGRWIRASGLSLALIGISPYNYMSLETEGFSADGEGTRRRQGFAGEDVSCKRQRRR